MELDKYTYQAHWSPEDEAFVGLVAQFPSLSWLAPDRQQALTGIAELTATVARDLKAGEEFSQGRVRP